MLDTQISILSIDTGNFYSNKEARLHWLLHKLKIEKRDLKSKCDYYYNNLKKNYEIDKKQIKNINNGSIDIDSFNEVVKENIASICFIESIIKLKNKKIDSVKTKLLNKIDSKIENKDIRVLRNIHPAANKEEIFSHENEKFTSSKIINIFESNATRTIGVKCNEFCDDLIVVQIYYFGIAKDIILNGFIYNDNKYIYYTSSAGQIRQKKAVFIKESTWNRIKKSIMCGLTVDIINEKGGCNSNKYLAYLALPNSATDTWKEFNIDNVIVIDDFENNVYGEVDFIDEVSYTIERKKMNVPIPHTDGCGMILPHAFNKKQRNKMIRMPWIKGLLGVFDFVSFIKENKCDGIINDIYGNTHDVLKENIQVILTKSQFKMWKYYNSWEEYKNNFRKYNCIVGYTNEEEDYIKDATINYQMLQTLTDISDEELILIAEKSNNVLRDLNTLNGIKNVFGITPYNKNKTSLQEAINIYPNLINDPYVKEKIRDIKNSLLKKYRAGSLAIDGKYTFILPDLYAACEYWFLNIANPNGLLNNKEVYCNLFNKKEELDCLRSPHLYREHCIRKNIAVCKNRNIDKWFITNALYISCKDMISKVLMCDVDGDKALVVVDETIINVAKRNMNNVVPLYYNMKKAEPVIINNYSLYNGLNKSFVSGNIGIYSNTISKIWNDSLFFCGSKHDKEEAERIIKLLCCENNFNIDEAKTLYMPKRPDWFAKELSQYSNKKLPAFFKFAKDKSENQVSSKTESCVNKLSDIILNNRISLNKIGLKQPDLNLMVSNRNIIHSYQDEKFSGLISCFNELNKKYHFKVSSNCTKIKRERISNTQYKQELFFNNIIIETKEKMKNFYFSDNVISDVLVCYFYQNKSKNKDLLWMCYGDIILNNIKNNIDTNFKIIECSSCGNIVYVSLKNNRTHMCEKCYKEYRKKRKRLQQSERRKMKPEQK